MVKIIKTDIILDDEKLQKLYQSISWERNPVDFFDGNGNRTRRLFLNSIKCHFSNVEFKTTNTRLFQKFHELLGDWVNFKCITAFHPKIGIIDLIPVIYEVKRDAMWGSNYMFSPYEQRLVRVEETYYLYLRLTKPIEFIK
jgi:hypothetical protein